MCGLVGSTNNWKNGFSANEVDIFKHAMFLNQLRGSDSTGVVVVANDGETMMGKEVGGWGKLLFSPKWDPMETFSKKKGTIIVGHGRSATRGDTVEENAHPFERQKKNKKHKIILVHNGTLANYQQLPDFAKFPVDSEWLAEQIALLEPAEALGRINGAMALMWFDSEHKTFHAFRNHERPLWMVKTKIGGWLFNSELSSLWWLKYKFNIEFVMEPVELTPDVLYSWEVKYTTEYTTKKIDRLYRHVQTLYPHGYDDDVPFSPDTLRSRRAAVMLNRKNWQRNIVQDMKDLISMFYKEVLFIPGGGRVTTFSSGQSVNDPATPCYEPYLHKLTLIDLVSKRVRKTYKNGGAEWYVDVVLVGELFEVFGDHNPNLSNHEVGKSLIKIPYKAGKVVKFESKVRPNSADIVVHSAACNKEHPTHFDWYENNRDGKITVGDRVQMEVCHIFSTATKLVRVLGFRIKATPDTIIDVTFNTDKWDEKEIGAIGTFEGVVQRISVSLMKQFELTKSYISIKLIDVVPLVAKETANVIH